MKGEAWNSLQTRCPARLCTHLLIYLSRANL